MHRLLAEGRLERISHGLYLQVDTEFADGADLGLMVVAAANASSTLCLTSALVRHDLTDEIPTLIDVAVPRSARLPKVSAPVRWHRFAPATFELGREAFKAWLRQRGSQPSNLLEVAAPFPKAVGRLREDMRVLL